MGIGDLFKASKNKALQERVNELESLLTPEMKDLLVIEDKIKEASARLESINRECDKKLKETEKKTSEMESKANKQVDKARSEFTELSQKVNTAKQELVETDELILMQSFGLYKPRFVFANSTDYKDALSSLRDRQKQMIKDKTAVLGAVNWQVNGSASKGKKMVQDMQKLLLRAFNCECDDVVEHVKFNNIEASEKRIHNACSSISKLGSMMSISISSAYEQLKIDELFLAYEYQVKKQEEKEKLRQLKEEERERTKLLKEVEEARRKIEKEQKHYSRALIDINNQIANASGDELSDLLKKKAVIENNLVDLGKSLEDVDYRVANQKAGYVYIISNVGSFGEGVYKIGMTRRLEPMDRVDELGDASVPFNFDVHALIFTDDAPALEAALHRAFETKKVNMVNTRREFFRVTLDEIKEVVKNNFDKTVEFMDIPDAQQYRESEILRAKNA